VKKFSNLAVNRLPDSAEDDICRCVSYSSDWNKLINANAWVLKMKKCLRNWVIIKGSC